MTILPSPSLRLAAAALVFLAVAPASRAASTLTSDIVVSLNIADQCLLDTESETPTVLCDGQAVAFRVIADGPFANVPSESTAGSAPSITTASPQGHHPMTEIAF